MGHYITVEAEIDIDDYKYEIREILGEKPRNFKSYVNELEKQLTFYREEYWKTPQQILEDLKNL